MKLYGLSLNELFNSEEYQNAKKRYQKDSKN